MHSIACSHVQLDLVILATCGAFGCYMKIFYQYQRSNLDHLQNFQFQKKPSINLFIWFGLKAIFCYACSSSLLAFMTTSLLKLLLRQPARWIYGISLGSTMNYGMLLLAVSIDPNLRTNEVY